MARVDVAGLDAGLIYNTFPKMGDYWIPPGLLALDPAWRNFLDNLTTVQFDHRVLALTVFALIVVFWIRARAAALPRRARLGADALLVTAFLQVVLGILLATYYSASASDAWASTAYLQDQVAGGWFLRGLHHHGSSMMVIVEKMAVNIIIISNIPG